MLLSSHFLLLPYSYTLSFMQIASIANVMIFVLNELEMNAVSIERAREYSQLPKEVCNFMIEHIHDFPILQFNGIH